MLSLSVKHTLLKAWLVVLVTQFFVCTHAAVIPLVPRDPEEGRITHSEERSLIGQGGNITLINATPYPWTLTGASSSNMNVWDTNLPRAIGAGSSATFYVEWADGLLVKKEEDSAQATYSLQGTPYTFQLQASGSPQFSIYVQLQSFSTSNNPVGSKITIGWDAHLSTSFILSGTSPDNFWSTNSPSADWMRATLSTIGSRPLTHIAIPGTHDAGMSVFGEHTLVAAPANTITQLNSIGGQLSYGSRYFDIRPVISGGSYFTGHYGEFDLKITETYQGADGQAISDIIDEINAFTAQHAELIILNLSHDFDTDTGNSNYEPFTQDQWEALFQQLLTINNLYIAPNPTSVDLTKLTLNDFIGSGKAAVICILQPSSSVDLGQYANQGFYTYGQFNAYNEYADKDNLSLMATDQLTKMQQQRASPDSSYFLLSWTLTQSTSDAVISVPTILDLANIADAGLYSGLWPSLSKQTYPNIIYVDALNDTNVAALAVAINSQFAS